MALADFEVVEVVGRRDFHRARAFFRIRVIVGDNDDIAVHDRQPYRLANEIRVALVFGTHRDRRIAEHGFGSVVATIINRLGSVLQRILETPHFALDVALFHFEIRNGRVQFRIPVDQAFVAINQPLFVKFHKTLRTALDRPSSMVKRSRFQSQEAPKRRSCSIIPPPESAFQSQIRSMNLSRPRS